jgi:hypothetical protein
MGTDQKREQKGTHANVKNPALARTKGARMGHPSPEDDILISTNTIEGYFSILKRGINGVYHHVEKQHLHLSEFDFSYNPRH